LFDEDEAPLASCEDADEVLSIEFVFVVGCAEADEAIPIEFTFVGCDSEDETLFAGGWDGEDNVLPSELFWHGVGFLTGVSTYMTGTMDRLHGKAPDNWLFSRSLLEVNIWFGFFGSITYSLWRAVRVPSEEGIVPLSRLL
jgi:hypothetical protein